MAKSPRIRLSRSKIFVCKPASPAQETTCARQIVSTLARHAFRRPVTTQDTEMLMGFYQQGRNDGKFDTGIERALQRVLADPEFAFRKEIEPAKLAVGKTYRISDMELASRLSFFLWSSIPDDELINLASQNKLHDPAVLEQQVNRMLADSALRPVGGQFRRAMAEPARDADHFPNPRAVPGFRRQPAGRHAKGDRVVRRQRGA